MLCLDVMLLFSEQLLSLKFHENVGHVDARKTNEPHLAPNRSVKCQCTFRDMPAYASSCNVANANEDRQNFR
jgi:hypothetical protein